MTEESPPGSKRDDAQALYCRLLTSRRLSAVISAATWDAWCARARRGEINEIHIVSVALKYSLSWPHTRRNETFGEYTHLKLSQLERLQSFGPKKLATLVTCLAVALGATSPPTPLLPSVGQAQGNLNGTIADVASVSELHRVLIRRRRPSRLFGSEVWDSWRTAAVRNVGEGTAIESIAGEYGLSWPSTRYGDTLGDFAHMTLSELERQVGLGTTKLAALVSSFAAAAGAFDTTQSSGAPDTSMKTETLLEKPADKEADFTVAELLDTMLTRLTERESEVLRRRFGLDGHQQQTLSEIGADQSFTLTRERIRQIEVTALSKLKSPRFMRATRKALEREADQIWNQLNDGALVLTDQVSSKAAAELAPETRLAIAIVYGKFSQWLRVNAARFKSGWYRADVPVGRLKELSESALAWLRNNHQPVLFNRLCSAVDGDPVALRIAVDSHPKLAFIFGYVFEGNASPRKRRRVRLHRLMLASYDTHCTPAIEILTAYSSVFRDDRCSLRDIEIVMQDAPHLFLRCAEAGWVALGHVDSSLEPVCSDEMGMAEENKAGGRDKAPELTATGETARSSLAETIRSTLKRQGPLHLSKIMKICADNSAQKHAATSVGASLVMGNYVRLAPGVWGLPEHYRKLASASGWSGVLLSEADCRVYTRARHAGEPMDTYRMWTPAMEYQWARWAETNASQELFSSLLAVCDPSLWSVSAEIQARWHETKRSSARYRLRDALKYHLAEHFPTLSNLLRVAIVARTRGYVSWASANRVVGRRIDSHRSATNLALLVEIGVLTPARHWQERHDAAGECASFVARLAGHLHETGKLEWNSSLGKEVMEHIAQAGTRPHQNWAPEVELVPLRAAFEHGLIVPKTVDGVDAGDENEPGLEADDPSLDDTGRPTGRVNPSIDRFLDDG